MGPVEIGLLRSCRAKLVEMVRTFRCGDRYRAVSSRMFREKKQCRSSHRSRDRSVSGASDGIQVSRQSDRGRCGNLVELRGCCAPRVALPSPVGETLRLRMLRNPASDDATTQEAKHELLERMWRSVVVTSMSESE